MVRPEVKKKRRQLAEAAIQSKRSRKKLEKVVLRKKLKVDRNNVLAELKKVQLNPDQLDKFHSTSSMQTRGLKRFTSDNQDATSANQLAGISKADEADECLDASRLIKRKKRKLKTNLSNDNNKKDSSSSSEDTDAVSTDTEIYEYEEQNDIDKKEVETTAEIQEASDTTAPTSEAPTTKPTPRKPADTNGLKERVKNSEPAVFVQVNRDPKVEKARLELPIIGEEQTIMEAIRYNDIVIISGETGSGKTTQLPQFLYEAGYTLNGKLIGITEPRRVAAVAMSDRVAHELNLTNRNEVAYQIRFSGTVSDETRIKFMTDGVLLRECQNDFLLSKYSAIIIDEAHERSVFSDILIGLLSRIVPLRAKKGNPLKLIIMSATLRVTDFTENSFLFSKIPPVIKIDARQFPVTVGFLKNTPLDYLHDAEKKVCEINATMPRGGILVFVTSQKDVKALCNRLRGKPMLFCLGLYAMLPLEKQQLVFKSPPEGSRLCVIATNVAETSITIPNIKYVVDTGKEKKKLYDLLTGVSRFVTTWTSKSSAEQRKGRAGRVGPGHCYRLYSPAVYTYDMPEHAEVQILQKPVEDVLLQMKSMNIDNVVNFPFPTRPSIEALKAAEKKLILLGALDDSKIKTARFEDISKTEYASRPTALGKAMSKFAVGARCCKMIVLSPEELLSQVICLVSALTVREMFLDGNQYKELWKKWVGGGQSRRLGDFMLMIKAVCVAESFECANESCKQNGLRTKAMLEIHKLRKQLLHEVSHELGKEVSNFQEKDLKKPSEPQCKILCQLLLSSFCDHVARKIPDGELSEKKSEAEPGKPEKKRLKNAYECMETDEPVYIDSESVLKGEHPEYLIYKELYKGDKKMYMRDVAVIEPEWLPFYAPKLCNFADVSANTNSYITTYDALYDQIVCKRVATYGPLNWPLGIVDVPMHLVDHGVDIYKHFACLLFSGEILEWFKKRSSKLLSPPSIMTKPWSKLQPRTSKTLQALVSANVKTKKDLIKIWKVDPTFLRREYLAWIPESKHHEIIEQWEQLHSAH